MLVVPTGLLLLLELILRLAGYGYDPRFFIPTDIEGEPFLVQNEQFSRRFFPPETQRHPAAMRMRATKPAGTVRIFVLGESAAMGDPEPAFGPARYMEMLLRERYPGIEFEVINTAFTAINSHVILPIARECAQNDGDVWIIYMGNNEMVGPYGAVTIFGMQAPPRSVVRLSLAVKRTRLGQLGAEAVRNLLQPRNEWASWDGMAMFSGERVSATSPRREAVYSNFQGNLKAILDEALDSKAAIILNTVAVNLRDSPPFASVPEGLLGDADRARFDLLFDAGQQAQAAGEDERGAELFAEASELDDGFAEAHYRRAMCLGRLGRLKEAQKLYQQACDADALPFRTDSRLNELIRKAVDDHAGDRLLLVEAPDELAKASPDGLCGQESFYEHVHFNFEGAHRLGLAWARAVEQVLPETSRGHPTNEWVSQRECERQLALTDWNRKLVYQSVLQRLGEPPLSTQFNSADRIESLRNREQELLSNATPATVARAHRVYLEAITNSPDDHFLHEAFAAFLQVMGDLPGATREWRRVGELLPHDFLPWFQIGSLLVKQGEDAEGQEYLRKALALRPSLILGWSELGQSLGASGDWQAAVEALDRACRLRPGDAVLWAYKAKALAGAGHSEEAIVAYQRAVQLRQDYWEVHGELGDLFSTADRVPEAIAAYQAAIRAKPDYAMAHFNLGVMLGRQGRWDAAAQEFERTLELEPNQELARQYLANVRRLMKESENRGEAKSAP